MSLDSELLRIAEAENRSLRYLLWIRHGHDQLYGDDGEMQCGECRLDFKRDSIERIEAAFERQALEFFRKTKEAAAFYHERRDQREAVDFEVKPFND